MATTRNVSILTNVTGNNTQNYPWTFAPAYTAYNDSQNPQFNRTVTLTSTGILLTVGGNSSGIQIAEFTKAMAKINPSVTWPPVVSVQPSNSVIGYGNATGFGMNATDELGNDITYQWRVSINGANYTNVANGGVYSNATTNTLNVSNSAGLSGNLYVCVATNPSGNNTSNIVSLTTDPTITTQPANVSVAHPNALNISVVATGQTALAYQWAANNGAGFSLIAVAGTPNYSNFTTNSLHIGNSNTINGFQYRCIVSDSGGSQTSNAATVTVT